MLQFIRKDNVVIVELQHGIFHDNGYFELEIQQNQKYQAELLTKALQENLNRHLSRIKRDYYNLGWKEAKARTRKRRSDEFYGGWEK